VDHYYSKVSKKLPPPSDKPQKRAQKRKTEKYSDRISTKGFSDNGSYAPDITLTSLASSQSQAHSPEKKRKKLDRPVKNASFDLPNSNFQPQTPTQTDNHDPMDDLILGSLKPYQIRNIEKMKAEMQKAQTKEDETKRQKREQQSKSLEKSIESGRKRVRDLNEAAKILRRRHTQKQQDEEEKVSEKEIIEKS